MNTGATGSARLSLDGVVPTVAHIHTGAAGTAGPVSVALTVAPGNAVSLAPTVLTPAQLASLDAGELYVNIHSAANPTGEIRGQLGREVDSLRAGGLYFNAHSAAHPGGEIRGQIGRRVLQATAAGAQEVPSNGSAATGRAFVAYDFATRSIEGRFTLPLRPARFAGTDGQ